MPPPNTTADVVGKVSAVTNKRNVLAISIKSLEGELDRLFADTKAKHAAIQSALRREESHKEEVNSLSKELDRVSALLEEALSELVKAEREEPCLLRSTEAQATEADTQYREWLEHKKLLEATVACWDTVGNSSTHVSVLEELDAQIGATHDEEQLVIQFIQHQREQQQQQQLQRLQQQRFRQSVAQSITEIAAERNKLHEQLCRLRAEASQTATEHARQVAIIDSEIADLRRRNDELRSMMRCEQRSSASPSAPTESCEEVHASQN